jgi:dephospho-CoA kinase
LNWIVGLTGGIGSGKSAVAGLFAGLGAAVVDTDAIAHELTRPGGAAIESIRAAFGARMITAEGALDRAAMRARVFADAQAKARLEAILHPLIRAESGERCLRARAPYVVLVVPLMIESGTYRDRIRRLLVVDCSEATQVARTMKRSGLSAEQVGAIMRTQATRAQRLAAADDVIANDGPIEHLGPQVERLHADYLRRAEAAGEAG